MAERLGRYLLIRPLASGGMGEIILAEHTGLSGFAKRVVVKRIKPELARSSSYVELFLNEARIGSFLNHPNIVHIFDVGHESDQLWLVMEYVDGVDLKRLSRRMRLAGQALSPVTLAAIIKDVLSALEEAHSGGPTRSGPIIHRDLSPENILVARSGAVKVLDFGLAKWRPGAEAVPSMEGNMIFGKTRYMPPEQLRGHLIDVRADLFALGVVMYETLTGRLPFGSGSADAVLSSILAGRPESPTAIQGRPDDEIDRIIYRALEPRVEHRYGSAGEMRIDLLRYLEAYGPKLPLEKLRSQLHPHADDPHRNQIATSVENSTSSAAAQVPTEIGLAVAKRCGKCGGAFSALYIEGLIVDTCGACHGVWLDQAEIRRVLGERGVKSEPGTPSPSSRAPLDAVVGSCPSCRVGLRAYSVPGRPAAFEVCPECFGVWFDEGEFALLSQEDVVSWFRTLLDSLEEVT